MGAGGSLPFLYLCNAPEWLPMMLVSLLLDYLVCAKLVRSTVQMRGRRLVFWLSIIKNLLLMVLSLAWWSCLPFRSRWV